MSLVVIGSAKAAPGVTTLTVALAALCPGPTVAADLDPEGGDLTLRYRAPDGGPLDPEVGLLSLAVALRGDQAPVRGFRAVASPDAAGEPPAAGPLPAHLQATDGGLDVLVGVNGPDQAVGLGPLWAPLARALAETPATVFADCGRIGAASPAMPVVREADAVIMVARAEMEELAHLRERLRWLTAAVAGRFSGPTRLGVVLITGDRDRAAGPRTEQLLRASGLAVPVLGTVTDDPKGAARLRGIGGGRADRTTLIRSVRALVPSVAALAGVVAQPAPPGPAAETVRPETARPAPVRPEASYPVEPQPAPAAPAPPPPAPTGRPWRREPNRPPDAVGAEVPVVPDPPLVPTGTHIAPPEGAPADSTPAEAAPGSHWETFGEATHGGERWREVQTPPGGTGWPRDPTTGERHHDPYGVTPDGRRA